jgi:ribosomal subunit interface protein
MLPLRITYHGLESSDALNQLVEERVAKLSHLSDRMIRCRVLIEAPHRHHQHGNHYRVRVDVLVPGNQLVVGGARATHPDAYAALGQAFDSIERRVVEERARRRQGIASQRRQTIRKAARA